MGSESMTYAEMKGLGYGTIKERLGKVTTRTLERRYMLYGSSMLMFSGPHTGKAEQPMCQHVLLTSSFQCRMRLATTMTAG